MSGVLILTAHSGGGHVSLAQALRERLPPGAPAPIVDPLPRVVHLHYRLSSRHALALWAVEFHATNTPARALALHQLLGLLFGRRLEALLDKHQPELVLSTSSLLTQAVVNTLARRRHPAPCAVLFADGIGLHATWLTARASAATLAPTRESYQEALAAGFAPERLHLTGWPVRAQFYRADAHDRAATLTRLQLDPAAFTVFIQGGGEGTANIVRTVESTLSVDAAQVILAAGTNRALRERFGGAPGVRVIPFTPEIAPLMAAADVVLGKAGPNMLFEAVTLGKPFIASTYIPGQETGNLALIARYGLGWAALAPGEQRALLTALAEAPGKLVAAAATVQRYRAWNSAAVESIGPLLGELCRSGVPTYADQPQQAHQSASVAIGHQ